MKKVESARKYIVLALLSFLGFAADLLVYAVVSMLGADITTVGFVPNLCTTVIWVIYAVLLLRYAKNKLGYDMFSFLTSRPRIINIVIAIVLLIISIVISCISWGGLKPALEYNNLGIVRFIFQYIYYFAEALLILITIASGQKAGEVQFKITYIPWGGFFLAFTWGVVHILTQGLSSGLSIIFQSFIILGPIYLLCNKNIKYAYPLIVLAFIL